MKKIIHKIVLILFVVCIISCDKDDNDVKTVSIIGKWEVFSITDEDGNEIIFNAINSCPWTYIFEEGGKGTNISFDDSLDSDCSQPYTQRFYLYN